MIGFIVHLQNVIGSFLDNREKLRDISLINVIYILSIYSLKSFLLIFKSKILKKQVFFYINYEKLAHFLNIFTICAANPLENYGNSNLFLDILIYLI